MPTISECQLCGRHFFRTRECEDHCTPGCCKRAQCIHGKPALKERVPENQDLPEERLERKCVVCGCPRRYFRPFAPCSDDCQGGMYFQSSRSDPGFVGLAGYARQFVRACHLFPERESELHFPDTSPRIHVQYCSLRCYNSVAFGHETRERQGQRRRNRTTRQNAVDREGKQLFTERPAFIYGPKTPDPDSNVRPKDRE